jgi:Double zinc ribbon
MAPLALFGIKDGALNIAVNLILLVLVVLWLALVFWTYNDARRRLDDGLLVACATLASLIFPFIGTVIYMIVRPPEYLADRQEREVELAAAQARLAELEQQSCPHCGFEVERSFLRCPSCLRRLKEACMTCRQPLDPRWKICPYCESEIGRAPAQRRRAQPRSARTAAGTRGTGAVEEAAPAPSRPSDGAGASGRVAGQSRVASSQPPAT